MRGYLPSYKLSVYISSNNWHLHKREDTPFDPTAKVAHYKKFGINIYFKRNVFALKSPQIRTFFIKNKKIGFFKTLRAMSSRWARFMDLSLVAF